MAEAYSVGMRASIESRSNHLRSRIAAFSLMAVMTVAAASPASVLGQDASPSPEASSTPAEAACASADDLTLIVDFLRETDAEEDGWLPLLVGSLAGISEARDLVGYVGEVYQPLIEDLIVSLQDLRDVVEDVRAEDSLGSQLVVIGEAVTDIGTSMDVLGDQLRTRCDDEG